MVKIGFTVIALAIFAFFLTQAVVVFGQTPTSTPTMTPSPTKSPVVPSGAPSTGFGPN